MMQSIRGIYTGKEIKPLEDIHVRPNVSVIITFLDDMLENQEQTLTVKTENIGYNQKTCGNGWGGAYRCYCGDTGRVVFWCL